MSEQRLELAPIIVDDTDLAPAKLPVKIRGKACWLVEVVEEAAVKYQEVFGDGTTADPNTGVMRLGNRQAEAQVTVLSMCLYEAVGADDANPDGNLPLDRAGNLDPAKRIRREVILRWPHRTKERFWDMLKLLSPGFIKEDNPFSRKPANGEALELPPAAGVGEEIVIRAQDGDDLPKGPRSAGTRT